MSDNNNNNNNNNNNDILEGTQLNHWSYHVVDDWLSHQIYYFLFLCSFLSLFFIFFLTFTFPSSFSKLVQALKDLKRALRKSWLKYLARGLQLCARHFLCCLSLHTCKIQNRFYFLSKTCMMPNQEHKWYRCCLVLLQICWIAREEQGTRQTRKSKWLLRCHQSMSTPYCLWTSRW